MKSEKKFLKKLQERARQQSELKKSVFFPQGFLFISEFFGENPWKVIIPLAFFLSLSFYLLFGARYFDLILFIFRKI